MFIRVNLRHPCHPRSMENVGSMLISGKYQRTSLIVAELQEWQANKNFWLLGK